MDPEITPPRRALRFFQWYCHPEYLEDIEGDLHERFLRNHRNKGRAYARRRYIQEVLFLFRPTIIKPLEGSTQLNQYGMLKNYFKSGMRNFLKNKTFSFINLTGLTAGITCCLLIYLYVGNELSFDTYHQGIDKIYRVLNGYKPADNSDITAEEMQVWGCAPVGPALQNEFPSVQAFCRFTSPIQVLMEAGDKRFQENEFIFADSTALEMFSWRMLSGSAATALDQPNSIVLTKSLAEKYFGDEDPVGSIMTIDQTESYKVTGVMEDVPANSSFTFPGLISMTTFHNYRPEIFDSWGYVDFYTYLIIDPLNAVEIKEQLPDFLSRNVPDEERYTLALEPMSGAYLHSQAGRQPGETGNYENIYLFSFIAIFILMVACINYMNLSTARSLERAREIGIRKTVGAAKGTLVVQFLFETILFTFMAGLLAIILTQIALPWMVQLSGKELDLRSLVSWVNVGLYIAGLLFLGVIAGIYPAFILAGFKPAVVLKGGLKKFTRGLTFRKSLVVFQFVLSIALIAGTIIVYTQVNYLREHSLGLEKDHQLIIDFGWDGELQDHIEQVKQTLSEIPGIQSVSASRAVPGDFLPNAGTFIETPEGEMKIFDPYIYEIDPDFIKHYQIGMAAGRNFSPDFVSDSTEALLLNETAAREFGYPDPADIVGKKFTQWGREGKIVGVVKDFNFKSLHTPVEPLSIRFAPKFSYTKFSLKLKGDQLNKTMAALTDSWTSIAPQRPLVYNFLDENFDSQYQQDVRFGNIFTSFAVISIFIACLGLLGLTIYTTNNRKKEIGIRKVLGATTSGIIRVLSKDYALLFLLATCISIPFTWFTMEHWLTEFPYRTNINFGMFLLAILVTAMIAILSICFQVLKSAISNPVESLKNE